MNIKYSKKVMQNFMNPKNMGEIKNPDGVGKVGNPRCGDIMWIYIKVGKDKKGNEKIKDIKFKTFGCLPPYEKINKKNVWEEISKINKNDFVLNRCGENAKVKKIYQGNFSGELLYIIPFVSKFNGFCVTPTHPVLVVKRKFLKSRTSSKKCDWLRVDESELILSKPYYVEAELLEKGDYLIFPKISKTKDSREFNRDLMRLLGYYLSEGYITAKGHVLNFAFNKNEKKYIGEVKNLIAKIMKKEAHCRIRKNVCEVYVCSKKWCGFFEKHCSKLAKNKKLSEEIMELPFKKQWEMLKTYVYGDGNIYKRRKKDSKTYRADTVSEELAVQIQRILARGNIFASIKKYNKPATILEGRKLKPFIIFNVSFKISKKHKFVKEHDDYFLVPIKEIQKEKFKGKVYNLEVSGKEHSYLTKGFIVHNCAAAIATSSMITQVAKGKSLEDAEKIKYKDVVKSLGGLPEMKVHCSHLAQEALKRAIEDYRKGSKKSLASPSKIQERKN